MYDFMAQQATEQKPFNWLGAMLLFFRPVHTGGTSWFCSQLVVAAMQEAGLLQHVRGEATRARLDGQQAAGKTGTTQDYRDALFVGYAGDLVVGVWVGNDDNTPLNGVTGGSTPARIWRDFMRGALKIEAAPSPQASDTPDPEGPVQPLDVLEGEEIPLGQDGTSLRIEEGGVIIRQDGVPVEVRLNEGGVVVQPSASPSPGQPPL